MESNYIVTLVYRKLERTIILGGMVSALSADEAVVKAKMMHKIEGTVILYTSVACDVEDTTYFSDINTQNQ